MQKKTLHRLSRQEKLVYLGLCILLLGMFFAVFSYLPKTGFVGRYVRSFSRGMLGAMSFILPVYLLAIAAVFLFAKLRKRKRQYFVAILMTALGLVMFFDIFQTKPADFRSHFYQALDLSASAQGGGLIGFLAAHFIRLLLGDVGAYICIICIWIFAAFTFLQVNRKDIISNTQKVADHVEQRWTDHRDAVRERKLQRLTQDQVSATPDPYASDRVTGFAADKLANELDDTEILQEIASTDSKMFEAEVAMASSESTNTGILEVYDYTGGSMDDAVDALPSFGDWPGDGDDVGMEFDTWRSKEILGTSKDHLQTESSTVKPVASANHMKGTSTEQPHQVASVYSEDRSKIRPYQPPSTSLLKPIPAKNRSSKALLQQKAQVIEQTLKSFGVDAKVDNFHQGPTITCYEVKPAIGVKVSRITALQDDLCLALETQDIRIVAPIPGKSCVGIETPNPEKEMLGLRELLESEAFRGSEKILPMALGKDISGSIVISSIAEMPHLLIAGATGSGKSVCINSIILSILFHESPDDVRLVLIDPKVVELSVYNRIPHLLIPVVTDTKDAGNALEWAVSEMERRYMLFSKTQTRDFGSYMRKIKDVDGEEKLKRIVIIIDELADLMLTRGQEVENSIARLAQMARAAGIYMILATQRPSVDVITGTIKANIPSRISFAVSSQIDSRTILDTTGAEKLLGKGDMLFSTSSYPHPVRIQGAYVSDAEIERVVAYLQQFFVDDDIDASVQQSLSDMGELQEGSVNYDELLGEAIRTVVMDQQGSVSYLQRRLSVGYSRAARMIDTMEELGIVGKSEGSKPRKVLITLDRLQEVLGELGFD